VSSRCESRQMKIGLGFLGHDSFRQVSAVVFDQPVLPLEKVGDGLRLDPHLDSAQAGQQKIHLPHQADLAALALPAGFHGDPDFTAFRFQQSPLGRKFFGGDEPLRNQVEAFAAHRLRGIFAERLVAVGKEVGAGDFALNHHGTAFALPGDDVGRLAARTRLLGKNDAATITGTEPLLGKADERGVGHGHGDVVAQKVTEEK
jgi:hypothetical protein